MKKGLKKRNPIAYDMYTNGLYRHKVIQSKKIYNRKKIKKGKDLLKYLSPLLLSNFYRLIIHHLNSVIPTITICFPCG
jgi:hypothetical protein